MTQSAALPLNHTPDHAERRGLLLGFIGMAIFSQTLPFTRMAVAELDATFVALARAVLASLLALALLAATGGLCAARRPRGSQWWRLAVTAAGVVVGFPLLSSLAMRDVPAAHGAIITGLLPLATAVFAAWFGCERPSPWFWACALTGSALVVTFALLRGAGTLHRADWLLFASMVAGALGYAVGGKLSRELGGTQTIAWALMVSLPVLLPVVGALVWLPASHQAEALARASGHAWLGLAYVSVFSMFVGFLFWYSGLAAGGVARVGQIQLLQPFMTLIGGWLLLGEPLDAPTVLFALAVIAVVGLGQRATVRR
ncbi:hypothetical protein LMG10661_03141 [Ralstonia syzygii subsp. syzygii]|nr:hypothetical protein LMG10661_03141 [Ralstonia syzygii subsp. syzygii]